MKNPLRLERLERFEPFGPFKKFKPFQAFQPSSDDYSPRPTAAVCGRTSRSPSTNSGRTEGHRSHDVFPFML